MTHPGQPSPSVNLHIERLVLDGVPLASAAIPALQAAITAELGRTLSRACSDAWSDLTLARCDGGRVAIDPQAAPAVSGRLLGGAIARAIMPSSAAAHAAASPTAS